MPDLKHKLVHVNDLGVVAFPSEMPDQQVASVIKQFRSRPKSKSSTPSIRPAGSLFPQQASWSDIRSDVMRQTEPHPVDDAVTMIMKRTARGLFGVADFVPQTAGILRRLFSSDPNISSQAEGDLLSLHPGAQISDRAKEAMSEWKQSRKLATANVVGDALALFLAKKLEVPEEFKETSPWYLKSERVIADKMKGPMPADDLHKMLIANGVKPEEMKWIGLDEFLRSKGKEAVRPEELRNYPAANNLQVNEITKGAGPNLRVKPSTENPGEFDVVDPAGLVRTAPSRGGTKFGSYTLPGGQNYRELLLTLPASAKEVWPREIAYEGGKWLRKEYGKVVGSYETQTEADYSARHLWGDDWRLANSRVNNDRDFTSGHWDEPNVVGHVRFNDRTGPNGEKLLHLEELQSDWHQKGRTKGYQGELLNTKGWKATKTDDHPLSWTVDDADGSPIRVGGRDLFYGKTAEDAIAEAARTQQTGAGRESRVPDAPFKKTWPELLLKRMMKYAVDDGYDGISWTPGEEQAARYDLSKQVDKIVVIPTEGGERAVRIHTPTAGESIKLMVDEDGVVTPAFSSGNEFAGKNISDVVGKDVAEKIMTAPKETALTGVDLKVGGEGMKGFYDKIVPELANKLGKQFGAKVGETKASVGTLARNDRYGYTGPELSREDVSQIYKDVKEGRRDNPSLAEGTNFVNRSHLAPTLVQIAGEMGKGTSYSEAVGAVLADNKNLLENYAKEMGGKIEQKKYQFKKVPYFPITDAMRKAVGSEGMPLFEFVPPALLAAGALSGNASNVRDLKTEALHRSPHQVTLPSGIKFAFPTAAAVQNFKKELGIP